MELAEKAGSAKAVNTVLLGALAKKLELTSDKWHEVISRRVPAKTVEMNKKAFESGYSKQ
jgi:indolepyruvate ferredoxin oxidoreductase beta subunit